MEFLVNGEAFRVGVAAVGRSYRREEKYRVTTEDGKVHSEVRGVYADFSLVLGNVDGAEYDRLMATLASAGEVSVTLGERTYTGIFDGVSDGVSYESEADGVVWDDLTLTFVGTVPLGEGEA